MSGKQNEPETNKENSTKKQLQINGMPLIPVAAPIPVSREAFCFDIPATQTVDIRHQFHD